MNIQTTTLGIDWRVCNTGVWPILLATATTIGHSTKFDAGICPDAQSLAHEFHHVLTTNTIRYLWSWSLGRLWKDDYWKQQERDADSYALSHKDDPAFLALAYQVRSAIPTSIPTVTVTHPV